jgi:hypothetical protein
MRHLPPLAWLLRAMRSAGHDTGTRRTRSVTGCGLRAPQLLTLLVPLAARIQQRLRSGGRRTGRARAGGNGLRGRSSPPRPHATQRCGRHSPPACRSWGGKSHSGAAHPSRPPTLPLPHAPSPSSSRHHPPLLASLFPLPGSMHTSSPPPVPHRAHHPSGPPPPKHLQVTDVAHGPVAALDEHAQARAARPRVPVRIVEVARRVRVRLRRQHVGAPVQPRGAGQLAVRLRGRNSPGTPSSVVGHAAACALRHEPPQLHPPTAACHTRLPGRLPHHPAPLWPLSIPLTCSAVTTLLATPASALWVASECRPQRHDSSCAGAGVAGRAGAGAGGAGRGSLAMLHHPAVQPAVKPSSRPSS